MNTRRQSEDRPSARNQFLAADPSASAWVSASAGTGKTHVLTNRVLRLMLSGTLPQRILCLTYTRAAASQMANRINAKLGRWTVAGDVELAAELTALTNQRVGKSDLELARRLFAGALDAPGGLKILTLHSFCQSLLGRFPLEAGLSPQFELMDERSAAEMLADASQTVLSRVQSNATPALSAALADLSGRIVAIQFGDLTKALAAARGRFTDLLEVYKSTDGVAAGLRALFELADGDDEESVVRRACADDVFDADGLRRIVPALLDGSKNDVKRGQTIADWLSAPGTRISGFDQYSKAFLTQDGTIQVRLVTKKTLEKEPDAEDILTAEAARLLRVQEVRRGARVVQATASLMRVGEAQLAAYADAKTRHATLDYEDLILKTRDLLGRRDVAPWVLFKLDGGIDHILIDEAQDTSPDQWRIVGALAEEFFSGLGAHDGNRSVFAVGDVKQSIYSFQGADPEQFDAMRKHFQNCAKDAEQPFRSVPLETSFRSTSAVLALVDEVFAPEEVRDGLTFGDQTVRHTAFRKGQAGLVEVWPTVVPSERESLESWAPPVVQTGGASPEEELATAIADTIRGWLDQGEVLQSRGRPVAPGDILVLVRRRSEFVEHLVAALKKRNVPVAGADRMVLTEQLAVMDLIALGRFVLLPTDDLTLAEVLKGPLIGLDDDQLFEIAHGRGGKSLWNSLRGRASEGDDFAAAEAFLAQQLARADYAAPFEFFARILGPGQGRRRMAARLGSEANDPIDEFLNLALDYEKNHPPSLQGFLHWVGAAATEVKRDMEHTRDEVRVMTVHGAKGLEAPIVFLPDTTTKPQQGDPFLWLPAPGAADDEAGPELLAWPVRRENEVGPCAVARDKSSLARDREYRRLLYVALTRAEDRLYVCGWETSKGRKDGCWYDLVANAVERMDGFEVVERDAAPGVRRLADPQTAPVEGSGQPEEATLQEPLPGWASSAPVPEPVPSRPLVPSRPRDEEPPVLSPVTQEVDGGGLARGRHVHRLLQLLPDLPPPDREAAARRYFAGAAGELDRSQTALLITEVLGILGDSEFASLFGPHSQAEVPVAGMVGDFALAGQIDRLVVSEHRVLIIDYKTNRNPPKTPDEVPAVYLNQMAIYRAAISEIFPDRAVHCALLWTEGPTLMPLTDTLLHERAP